MKNKIFLFLLLFFIISCHRPSYYFTETSSSYGIDFPDGKWLMNRIEAPESIKQKLTEIAMEGFSERLGNNLFHINQVHGILVPGNIPLNPRKELLQSLKIGTKFDYFINIKTTVVENELGSLQFGEIREEKRNVSEVTLEIYDLNTAHIIYNQSIVGIVSVKNDNKDFALVRGTHKIIIGGLKRIMKKIDRASL